MIIYPSSLVLAAAAAGIPLTHARIGYQTWLRDLAVTAVTASTEAAGFPKDAPLRPNTFEYWKPTALPATLTFDMGQLRAVDYVGILGSLGSSACAISARLSDSATDFASYLSLPGTVANYASTPDSAANSGTGDRTITMIAMMPDWTPSGSQMLMAKRASPGTFAVTSYGVFVDSSGIVNLVWSDGASLFTKSSTAAITTVVADGAKIALKIEHDVNNGAAGNDVRFYTATDYNKDTDTGTWVQLGATVTTAGVTSVRDGAEVLEVGTEYTGTDAPMNGRVYFMGVKNSIGGSFAVRFDPDEADHAATSWTSSTGEVWNVNQSGTPNANIVRRLIGDELMPADDAPIMLLDTERLGRYLQLRITGGSTMPKIAVCYAGVSLAMQRMIYGGHTPIPFGRNTELNTSLSKGGEFLGQQIRRMGVTGSAAYKNLTAAWYRTYFDPFAKSARRFPFFFAWRPLTYPNEVGYVWAGDDIVPSNMGKRDYMQVSWKMQGWGYE